MEHPPPPPPPQPPTHSLGVCVCRLHLVTKHRVFSGPGFLLAQELSDAADGGQVLLSHDAWLNLRHNMCQAGFPQVEQLGMYKLEAWPAPVWIYQVTPPPLLTVPLPLLCCRHVNGPVRLLICAAVCASVCLPACRPVCLWFCASQPLSV